MGGLMGLGAMANHQELIVARAAGMSKARMARPVALTAVSAAIVVILRPRRGYRSITRSARPETEIGPARYNARPEVRDDA